MRDYSSIQKRYLRDPLPIRLGGLAANLARVRSNSDHNLNSEVVLSIIDESKHFIEWTAAEAEPEVAEELINLQIQLARWQRTWTTVWQHENQRVEMAKEAKLWSDRVLDWSGLLNEN